MKLPDNTSKYTPPLLPQVLSRPRLLNLLKKNSDKRLILILGQAAQGKSMLAASYVASSEIRSAWMNLGKEDSDPVNLFHLMGQSLQYAFEEIKSPRLLSYPSGTSGPVSEMAFFRDWARSLFERVSEPVQIVMDGLDRLSPEAHAFKLLQILVEEARPNVHLMMLSREVPPLTLEFQHLKVRREAFILTNEELAFTLNEIKDYFQKVQGIALNPDQLKIVHSTTEGWVGALILLSDYQSSFRPLKKEDVAHGFSWFA